jgi:polygalacturonase
MKLKKLELIIIIVAASVVSFAGCKKNDIPAKQYALFLTTANGTVVRNPSQESYPDGAIVQLTAVANPGFFFASWSGDTTSVKNPLIVKLKEDKNITANFSSDDTKTLQSLIDQCPNNGTVTIPAGTHYIDALVSLNLKSNMTLKLESGAILKALPNDKNGYYIVKLTNVSNVKIVGGTIQGERSSHFGTTGEWGMCIGILGSSNVSVSDLTVRDGWGDGIYVGYSGTQTCRNISIENVISDNNRRVALGIISVDGMIVKNSVFKNSNGTDPQSGIDIEPNDGNTVTNVQVFNSQFLNNINNGVVVQNIVGTVSNILFNGNYFMGNKWGWWVNPKATNVVITGCTGQSH